MLRGRSYAIVADERDETRFSVSIKVACFLVSWSSSECLCLAGGNVLWICSNFVQMLRPDDADVIER
ncbi:unnamed protein product [Fusarium graminearum]|uniref:Chromosome 1, complete genome n=1 Tax=Gibberella zeae (strain ATCC MYA-4620 / CBS 123657 / FGSC 9075 / NRRL 31084 / PH-1) TaxID=229533 RepID=A0A0E0RVW6_GIBZE|nr:hypothetical protein FG05_35048 [Fusarium graminearum]CEF75391.1 unnamed protein product [Fusarium graminearum]CZS78672.1 unnamed protein product [Fusarium graminearum]